ncbi:MAG: tungstate transport system permease protein [Solirubrobacteraceae bacterium]|jgi:tungstate transport system permease protein|nr:tungstate transport system permease protein [Solirubrobacteraceae bacterium]
MLRQAGERIGTGDAALVAITWRTVRLAVESTAIALVIGLPVAHLIAGGATRARRVGLMVANAGLGLPPVVLGIYLALVLLPASPLGDLNWTYTLTAIVVAQTLLALPILVALTASAIRSLPGGLLEQARAFGASGPQRAVLALREARIGVIAAVIVALGSAVAEVGAVVIVGGNVRGQTNTLASTVLLDLAAGDAAGATADVLVLLLLVLVLGAGLTVVQHRGPGRSPPRRRRRRRGPRLAVSENIPA